MANVYDTGKYVGDHNFNSASTFSPKDGSVSNRHISSSTDIDSDKLEHLHKVGTNFGLEYDATPSTGTTYSFIVYVCEAAAGATVRGFHATMVDTGSQANTNDFAFDLKKAAVGSDTPASILSATVDLDTDTIDNTPQDGSLSNASLAAGDLLIVEVTTPATITGANGMYAWVEIDETAG